MSSWTPPETLSGRPVAVIGAGVLGRRIGCVWASGGFDVSIYDPNIHQCAQAKEYIAQNIDAYALKTGKNPATFNITGSLQQAVEDAWLVIECVPEKLEAKIKIFGELVALTREDAILATNSSSYKSSEMLAEVPQESKARILNMHYYMPPVNMVAELMTDGFTDPAIIEYLVERSRQVATLPYVARKESTGFIFNRLWAAVKRETLTILAEGVSTPEEIDSMWSEMFVKGGSLPCKTMDAVGLDTVAFIESHYVAERGLSSEKTVDYLKRNFLDSQRLGNKSSNGGLYPPTNKHASPERNAPKPQIFALDIGLSSANQSSNAGEILELTPEGQIKPLVKDQAMPDGLAIDTRSSRMFWTCMGTPGKPDGAIYSADLDGSHITTVVASGLINTPKQLVLDPAHEMVYFCDREGQAVFRCGYDGSHLRKVVDSKIPGSHDDVLGWCVGIALSSSLRKLFWTQKGPSKGGKGRLFSADLSTAIDAAATGVRCLLSELPEPIDLEFDEDSRTIYWTDRGELPHGNALYKAQLDANGDVSSSGKEILAKHFHEAIGLKLDPARRQIYVTDLGGSIYCYKLDGKTKETVLTDEKRAFTGVTCI